MGMRLAEFIATNTAPILAEWEAFARSVMPGAKMDPLALRDHAEDILRATARDMMNPQSAAEQASKSTGHASEGSDSQRLTGASEVHGVGRVGSGFDLLGVVSEYRALRASVIRLWRRSDPHPDLRDLDDLTRFNESIDQSLTKAVGSYTSRVDQSRRMFLAILAHDLRNPLNSIMMSADLVSHTGAPDASEAASQISASAGAISRLVSDLLDFAGTGLGNAIPLSRARTDLRLLCREVVNEFRAAHPARSLLLDADEDLSGEWDASRLRQVLSNLLGNALQHGGEDCEVALTARAAGPDVTVEVRNGGAVIPPGLLPTIFDPLVRGSSPGSPPRRPGSIGIGLYIVREIVDAHGGEVTVESTAAEGTTFTARLPRHDSFAAQAPA
jgi:signal transduction histidine kinase